MSILNSMINYSKLFKIKITIHIIKKNRVTIMLLLLFPSLQDAIGSGNQIRLQCRMYAQRFFLSPVRAVGPVKPESNIFPASAAPVNPDVTVWNAESSFVHTTV